MLYSHLQFEVHERRVTVVVIEPVLCFLNFFPIFLWSGMSSRQLTLPISFDTKNTQIYPNFASVYAEYAVD